MKRNNKIALRLFVLLGALTVIGCMRVKGLKPEPLGMDYTLVNAGTKGEIRIVRDENYLPHIVAGNEEDVYFGLGFVMAQDRFSQMDVARKVAEGRISELLGSTLSYKGIDLVSIDVLIRVFRYWEDAVAGYKAMSPKDKAILDAFTNGVNKYLAEIKNDPPFEATTLGVELEPWRPEDSLAAMGLYGLSMTIDCLFADYYTERIFFELKGEKARDFLYQYPSHAPVITAELDEPIKKLMALKHLLDVFAPHPKGSNNWVVGASKSATGKALLANDPHLPMLNIPEFWYLCHLKCPSFEVMGTMFPAFPGFGAASTGKIAWGLTNVMADYIDLFREKINPENSNQYLYKGKWEEFQVVTGEVKIKNRKKPYKYSYRMTRHGSVIDNGLVGKYKIMKWRPGEVMAMKTVDNLFGTFLSGYLDLPRAKNWSEFRKACAKIGTGPIAWNHVYADAEGNAGYQTTANIPIREDNEGYFVHEGWTGESDWVGYIPFDMLPYSYNPAKGYLATANNRVASEDYPFYISASYIPFRAERINEYLSAKPKLTIGDMMELQADVVDIHARHTVPYIIEDLADSTDPDYIKIRDILVKWNESGCRDDADEIAPTIYHATMKYFVFETFSDELGKELGEIISSGFYFNASLLLDRIMPDSQNIWFDDVKTARRETRKDVTNRCVKQGVKWVKNILGANIDKWQWGKIHTLTLGHTLNIVPAPLLRGGDQLKRGPYPLDGGDETVNNALSFPMKRSGFRVFLGSSNRFIVDFATPEFVYLSGNAGMSSNPTMPNYDNLTQTWLKCEYVKMYFKEDDFRKNKKGEIIIKP